MDKTTSSYGIVGHQAPELEVPTWINSQGQQMEPFALRHTLEKFIVIYCFQAWCPGCHSHGFPSLQKMVQAMQGITKVSFMAIQTVFEGWEANTLDRAVELQKDYNLQIPFGHDPGNEQKDTMPSTMNNYRTGGTPWFIFIDQQGKVVFNNYHLNPDKAITFINALINPI